MLPDYELTHMLALQLLNKLQSRAVDILFILLNPILSVHNLQLLDAFFRYRLDLLIDVSFSVFLWLKLLNL